MKHRIVVLMASILLIAPTLVNAELIIDTGVPGQSELRSSLRNSNSGGEWYLFWRAGKFELKDSYSLTGFAAWTAVETQGSIRWAIYSDAGNPPDEFGYVGNLGTRLWSIDSLSPATTSNPEWVGVDGFAVQLAAGTYWLAIEIPIGQPTFLLRPIGNPSFPNDPLADTLPPNPLLGEAGTFGSLTAENSWSLSGSRFGYRIYGDMVNGTPTFADVSPDHWAFSFIEKLATTGITSGCGGGNYCPSSSVTRAQMAVFLERGIRGSSFIPPPASGNMFLDVAANSFAANFIEQFALDGITAGCGGNKYCPDGTVTRDQMAVFLLRAKNGAGYSPPAATGMFADVPLNHWAVHWIEQLAREGITGGCGSGKYCPDAVVTRDQMAVFLVRTFGL